MSVPEADRTFRDSGDLRKMIEESIQWLRSAGPKEPFEAARARHKLQAVIAHALVNISDDIFVIRERLNEGVTIQEGT